MSDVSPECIITEVSDDTENKTISLSFAKEFTPMITAVGDQDFFADKQMATNETKNCLRVGLRNLPGDHGDVPTPFQNIVESNCPSPNSSLLTGFGLDSRLLQNSNSPIIGAGMPKNMFRGQSRRLSTLLLDKVDSMDESQLRDSLNESLKENALLLGEVVMKDKTIRRLTESLNDMNDFSQTHYQSFANQGINVPSTSRVVDSDNNISEHDNSCCWDLGYGVQAFSHHGNQIEVYSSELEVTGIQTAKESRSTMFEELSLALRENRPILEHNVITGTYILKDVLVGGSLGWLAAYLLKKFGTTFLIAFSGGSLAIHLAARRGYVAVNWGEIYKEIEKKSADNTPVKSEMDWVTEKAEDIKQWIELHKYVASGFLVSVAYNIFK